MAGGLFGVPFVFNVKCIIFSLICMALFLYNPSSLLKNKYLLYVSLFIIFVLAYVAMAWYDYFYDCQILPLKRGTKSFTGLFKPPAHEPEKQVEHKMSTEDTHKHHILIYLLHLLIIVPLLSYIAYYQNKSGIVSFVLLGALSVFTMLYHGIELTQVFH